MLRTLHALRSNTQRVRISLRSLWRRHLSRDRRRSAGEGVIRLLLALLILASVGCGTIPTKRLDAFAQATGEISANVQTTDTRIERLAAHHAVDVADPDKPITATSFELINSENGKSYDLADDFRYRELALKTVSDYAALLKTFGEGDSGSEIDKASTNLAGSLNTLGSTLDPVEKQNIHTYSGIAATAVDLGGRALTEYMRRRALITAMSGAKGDLEQICSAFSRDLSDIKAYVAAMNSAFVARANALRPRVRSCPPHGTTQADQDCYRGRREDELSRMKADTDTQALMSEVTQVTGAIDAISKAVTEIPKAHSEILDALQSSATTSQALEELISAAQRTNSFYRGLK